VPNKPLQQMAAAMAVSRNSVSRSAAAAAERWSFGVLVTSVEVHGIA